jgi:hypothetical protein
MKSPSNKSIERAAVTFLRIAAMLLLTTLVAACKHH